MWSSFIRLKYHVFCVFPLKGMECVHFNCVYNCGSAMPKLIDVSLESSWPISLENAYKIEWLKIKDKLEFSRCKCATGKKIGSD